MREVGRRLSISHSTISRYKVGIYKKRKIDINKKYEIFIKYLFDHYDRRNCGVEVCLFKFKRSYRLAPCPTMKQVYNWINAGKIYLTRDKTCYKKHKSKNKNGMMSHPNLLNKKNKKIYH